MTRNEFILSAMKDSDAYTRAEWVFALFTVMADNEIEKVEKPYDYQIGTSNSRYHYYLNNQWNPITDSPAIDRPLWLVEETVIVTDQSQMIQKANFPLKTRAGNFFINHYCLVYIFGDRFEYQNGKVSIGDLEDLVAPHVVDNDKVSEPHHISVTEAKRFLSATASMAGFASIASPSATPYTMVPAPGIKELREKLIEENKDKLNDPAVVAKIDAQLVEHDRAWLNSDPEGGFTKEKGLKVSRKKLFSLHGYEVSNMQPKPEFIDRSLSEGWDLDKLPAMINSLRDGSYNRGAKTALGGEAVKFIFRIFATTRIAEEDCGTTIADKEVVNDKCIGRSVIVNGQSIKLTEENIGKFKGQLLPIRSPGYCKTKHANFCMTCLGEQFRGSENSLAALASEVGSDMLNVFMSKMHGTALSTAKWVPSKTLF